MKLQQLKKKQKQNAAYYKQCPVMLQRPAGTNRICCLIEHSVGDNRFSTEGEFLSQGATTEKALSCVKTPTPPLTSRPYLMR